MHCFGFLKKIFEFSVAIPSYEPSTDAICLCLFMYAYAKKKKDGEKYLDAGSGPPWAELMPELEVLVHVQGVIPEQGPEGQPKCLKPQQVATPCL